MLTSLITMEMQTKITMRYQFTLNRDSNFKNGEVMGGSIVVQRVKLPLARTTQTGANS